MSKIKDKDTQPELILRRLLSRMKYRYRTYYGTEKIDIAFPGKKIAIFVDGCFWHSCPYHSHMPKSNRSYWLPKLKQNVLRSKEKDQKLEKEGWKVVHIWEHAALALMDPNAQLPKSITTLLGAPKGQQAFPSENQ